MSRASWSPSLWIGAIGTVVLTSCDLPPGVTSDGPHVLAITPSLDGPIDRDAVLRIELDRRIAPGSLYDGVVEITSGDNYVWLVQQIDVVHPAIVVRPLDPFDPEVTYGMRVHVMHDLDGHASTTTARVTFRTNDVLSRATGQAVPYSAVEPVFASCAGCHAGGTAPLGLDLSSASAVRATAIDVAAHIEAASVPAYLDAEVSAALVGLPRIAPHQPARSYLLYAILGDSHIAGPSMPYRQDPLPLEDIELVQRWIATGAATD